MASVIKTVKLHYFTEPLDRTKILILFLGAATAVFFTLRDFLPLYNEYSYNNQATQVDVILFDDDFSPPQMAITFPRAKVRDGTSDALIRLAEHLARNGGKCGEDSGVLGSHTGNQKLQFGELSSQNETMAIETGNVDAKIEDSETAKENHQEHHSEPFRFGVAGPRYSNLRNPSQYDLDDEDPPHRHMSNVPSSINSNIACSKLAAHQWDVWNWDSFSENSTEPWKFHNSLSFAIVRQLLSKSPEAISDTLRETNSEWNGPIISAAMNFIEWQYRMDYRFRPPVAKSDTLWHMHGPSGLEPENITDYDRKLEIIFDRVIEHVCRKLTFKELESSDSYSPKDLVQNRTCLEFLSRSLDPVTMDRVGLWTSLPPIRRSGLVKEYLWSVPVTSDAIEIDQENEIRLYPDSGVLYSTAYDGAFFSILYKTPIEKSYKNQRVTVKYSVLMRAKDTRLSRDECKGKSSVTKCFSECTKRYILEKCDCMIFSIRRGFVEELASNMSYCTSTKYSVCNITSLPNTTIDGCMRQCKASCEYTSYSWQITYESYRSPDPDRYQFILKLVPIFESFAEFSWTTKNTQEQFFAQLAGIANFYLGISWIGIFVVAVSVLEWWKRRRKNGKVADGVGGDVEGQKPPPDGTVLDDKEWYRKLREAWQKDMREMMRNK